MKNWKKTITPALWGFAFLALLVGLGAFTKAEAWGIHPGRRISENRVFTIFSDQLPAAHKGEAARLARALMVLSERHRIDPAFVLSVIHVESTFKPRALSRVGAVGLMQVMPATAIAVAGRYGVEFGGTRAELFDPVKNLEIGILYLKELLNRYDGMHPYYALAAYNMGPAKLNRMLSRPGFKPRATLKYYQDVTRGVEQWRFYEARFSGAKKLEAALKKGPNGHFVAENSERRPTLRRP